MSIFKIQYHDDDDDDDDDDDGGDDDNGNVETMNIGWVDSWVDTLANGSAAE